MMFVFSIRLLPLLLFALLTSCSTAAVVEDLNYSTADIFKAVAEVLPGGVATMSENQRELKSRWFAVRKNGSLAEFDSPSFALEKPPARYKAEVLVLGDRRPYRIEVTVEQQRLQSGGAFADAGQSEAMSHRLAKEIRGHLVKRQEKKNLIDDFRAF